MVFIYFIYICLIFLYFPKVPCLIIFTYILWIFFLMCMNTTSALLDGRYSDWQRLLWLIIRFLFILFSEKVRKRRNTEDAVCPCLGSGQSIILYKNPHIWCPVNYLLCRWPTFRPMAVHWRGQFHCDLTYQDSPVSPWQG